MTCHSRLLPELVVDAQVALQNHHATVFDHTGRVVERLQHDSIDSHLIKVDGSSRVTQHTRKHLHPLQVEETMPAPPTMVLSTIGSGSSMLQWSSCVNPPRWRSAAAARATATTLPAAPAAAATVTPTTLSTASTTAAAATPATASAVPIATTTSVASTEAAAGDTALRRKCRK